MARHGLPFACQVALKNICFMSISASNRSTWESCWYAQTTSASRSVTNFRIKSTSSWRTTNISQDPTSQLYQKLSIDAPSRCIKRTTWKKFKPSLCATTRMTSIRPIITLCLRESISSIRNIWGSLNKWWASIRPKCSSSQGNSISPTKKLCKVY